jgi:hypothetical protein
MRSAPLQSEYLSSIYGACIDDVTAAFRFSPNRLAPTQSPFAALPEPWAIITARNPMSRPLSEQENRHRDNNLLGILKWNDIVSHESFGQSADGSWREPSRLILAIPRDMALEIAREFQQQAIVWSEAGKTGILDCPTERWVVRPITPTTPTTLLGASRVPGKDPI